MKPHHSPLNKDGIVKINLKGHPVKYRQFREAYLKGSYKFKSHNRWSSQKLKIETSLHQFERQDR